MFSSIVENNKCICGEVTFCKGFLCEACIVYCIVIILIIIIILYCYCIIGKVLFLERFSLRSLYGSSESIVWARKKDLWAQITVCSL